MRKAVTILLSLTLLCPNLGLAKTKKSSSSNKTHSSKTHEPKTHASKSHKTHNTVTDDKAPAGAKSRCKDGSYSEAGGSGACSHHGGVDAWLK